MAKVGAPGGPEDRIGVGRHPQAPTGATLDGMERRLQSVRRMAEIQSALSTLPAGAALSSAVRRFVEKTAADQRIDDSVREFIRSPMMRELPEELRAPLREALQRVSDDDWNKTQRAAIEDGYARHNIPAVSLADLGDAYVPIPEPCVLIALPPEPSAASKGARFAAVRPEPESPSGVTRAIELAALRGGLDMHAVRDRLRRKSSPAPWIGGALLLVSIVAAFSLLRNPAPPTASAEEPDRNVPPTDPDHPDTDIGDEAAPLATVLPLQLVEATLAGIDVQIEQLRQSMQTMQINPEEDDGNTDTQQIEAHGRQMQEARVYALFAGLRTASVKRGIPMTVGQMETLLNEKSVTDLRMRFRFYRLAKSFFERRDAVLIRLQKQQAVVRDGAVVQDAAAAPKKLVAAEFGFTPRGKVEVLAGDVQLTYIFHNAVDYAKASSPNDPLWSKSWAKYSAAERVRWGAIYRNAERTAGMSFGEGKTIVRAGGVQDQQKTIIHEAGHEDDSLGPYFKEYQSPWALLVDPPDSDPAKELANVDAFLEVVYDTNGRRSLHTEMIQFLREGAWLQRNNPFTPNSIYDPQSTLGLQDYFTARYPDAGLRQQVLQKLEVKQRDFFAEVNAVYRVLKRLDHDFEHDAQFAADTKAQILGYLATRGSRDWDLALLDRFHPAP